MSEATFWQIRHKTDHSRNVWVSGVTGLCDLPEGAMNLAVGCKEIAPEDVGNWDIIQCPSWEDIQERIAKVKRGCGEMGSRIVRNDELGVQLPSAPLGE